MELPIFPLNGAVLFPETNLPLNIFEDKYIQMINYSLSKNRFIGMIQLDNNKNLYNIGCVGKIHSFNETDDGRYLISLHGTNCFKVIKEIKNKMVEFFDVLGNSNEFTVEYRKKLSQVMFS